MADIKLQNFVLGGIADSDYLGSENSLAEIVGFDMHSEPGILKVNQKLTKDSGSTVDTFCRAKVSCSDGKTYFFGDNGKIFSRASNGTWALEATAVPAAGSVKITGAREYQGWVYFAMQNRLGRFQVGTTVSSTINSNWATFTKGDIDFHPMTEVNLVLYIGDGNLIAQVDAGSFVGDALDLPFPEATRIKCLGRYNVEILIGTYVSSNIVDTTLYRWNTWSVSFSATDPIPEVGINAFLETDNVTFVNAGTKGNIYLYDGVQLEVYKTVKGSWRGTNKGVVHPEANLNFHGLPLFGFSQLSGAPCNFGVYSLGRPNRNYSFILALEFVISAGMVDIEIGAIAGNGDTFLVSWKHGTDYGVDLLDLSNKYSGAYFLTRALMQDRRNGATYSSAAVGYRTLPDGTSIVIKKKVNYGALSDALASRADSDRMKVETDDGLGSASVLQAYVGTTASGNTAPEIDMLLIGIED